MLLGDPNDKKRKIFNYVTSNKLLMWFLHINQGKTFNAFLGSFKQREADPLAFGDHVLHSRNMVLSQAQSSKPNRSSLDRALPLLPRKGAESKTNSNTMRSKIHGKPSPNGAYVNPKTWGLFEYLMDHLIQVGVLDLQLSVMLGFQVLQIITNHMLRNLMKVILKKLMVKW